MQVKPNWTDKLMAVVVTAWLVVSASLLTWLLVVGERPPEKSGNWTDDGNGISWSCTRDGQQVLRDNASGSITHGYDTRCDSNG